MGIRLRIKEAIEDAGLTQAQVAKNWGRTRSTLHNTITNGNPSIQTLSDIASAIGVPISHLYEEDGGQDELTALIYHKGEHYRATSVEELEQVVREIKEKK